MKTQNGTQEIYEETVPENFPKQIKMQFLRFKKPMEYERRATQIHS